MLLQGIVDLYVSYTTKTYLNPFYFQSHTLAFHFQLQHVIPHPCINLCNAPL